MDHSHCLHVNVHVSWESARDTLTAKRNGNGFRSPGKTILVAIESSSKEHTTRAYQVLVNYHADGQTFKFQPRPAQEFQFQFLFFNTRTQSDCACRGHGQVCLDRRTLLVSQTVVWIHPTLFWKWRPREWRRTNQIGFFDRGSLSKRLQTRLPSTYRNCPKCGGFWCVWKNYSWYFHWLLLLLLLFY